MDSMSHKGMNFTDGLALLLIAFKLANIIQWSWLWVLAPLWISFVIAALYLAFKKE